MIGRSADSAIRGKPRRLRISPAASSASERQVVSLPPMIEYSGTAQFGFGSIQCRREMAPGVEASEKGSGRTPA